ncbi:MAG: hypothetical protein H6733_16595 [Alphaproteobacteria bacterium]|nr:hypothetical protein [Alphaproteobacteria bacterium]
MYRLALLLALTACGTTPEPAAPPSDAPPTEPTPPPRPARPSLAEAAEAAAANARQMASEHPATPETPTAPATPTPAQQPAAVYPQAPNPVLALRTVNLALSTGDVRGAEDALPDAERLGADPVAVCLAKATIDWYHAGATVEQVNAGPPPGASRCR